MKEKFDVLICSNKPDVTVCPFSMNCISKRMSCPEDEEMVCLAMRELRDYYIQLKKPRRAHDVEEFYRD
jgi:hypothetical protein